MGKQHIPRRLSRKGTGKNAGAAAAVSAVFLLLLMLLVGAVAARYQRQLNSDGSVKARDFYFTSDFLDGGTHTLAPGSTEVTFTLGNHADDLRWSEVDINYTVTVTPAGAGAGSGAAVSGGSGTLAKGAKQDGTVTVSSLTPGTYTVEATGRGGYEKTLTAKLVVLSADAAVYKSLDTTNREYVLLTVWAQGYQGEVTIDPPDGVIPDNTDPVMADAKTGAAFTDDTSFISNGYSSHTYRFFGGGVTAGSFKVTYSNNVTATEKAPS